jgi:hypothetical protein
VDTNQQPEKQQLAPGIAAPYEVFEEQPVKLVDTQIAIIKAQVQKVGQKDLPAWREEIISAWEMRLFDRGFQNLLYSKTQGWTLPALGSGYHPNDAGSRAMFNANIFSSYKEMIVSALSRQFPPTRFEPNDEQNDIDITAAEAASDLQDSVEINIGGRSLLQDIDRLLCTDGRTVLETNYVKDAQKYGYESDSPGVVPEDESGALDGMGAQETSSDSGEISAGLDSDTSGQSGLPGPQVLGNARPPRGRETVVAHGSLESKLPMKANCLGDCDYAQISKEVPISIAKAEFPDKSSQISTSSAGPGGDNIARLARVNVKLGVENNFQTSDSVAYDVTRQVTWFRPSIFYDPDITEPMRDDLLKMFPNGCRVVYMGETFCEARNISMDDHLTLIHARSGDGMHRASLLKWLLPIQKVLNNLLDLANDYLVRGVPMTWFPAGPFSKEGIKAQTRVPGGFDFYVQDPGKFPNGVREAIFVEETLPFPEQLVAIIQWLSGDLAQLLTGCFPALFGGDTGSNDTMGGIEIQRDQALGRLGPVWGRIKEGLSSVMRQAVMCLSKSGQDVIKTVGKDAVRVETADLKGNVYCFPETDENFPLTSAQTAQKIEAAIQLAITNPMFLQIVDDPGNLELVKNTIGVSSLIIPQLASRDKQLGEIEILLKGQPLPNPKLDEAMQKVTEMGPPPPTPEGQQMAQQMQQTIAQISPETSSVPVNSWDDHDIESMTCLGKMRSPEGRAMQNGTQEEQMGFQNLVLHYNEHEALRQKNQPQQQKPPSVSINLKDLPPKGAAQAAAKAGIVEGPEDFEAQDVQQAAEKHPQVPIPVVPQQSEKVQ